MDSNFFHNGSHASDSTRAAAPAFRFGQDPTRVSQGTSAVAVSSATSSITPSGVSSFAPAFPRPNSKVVADVVVNSASLDNGMLKLNLERVIPEEKKPRLITVK